MSRSTDLAAALSARWISVRAGSVSGSEGVASSCCNWWIRKLRCALSADLAVAMNSAVGALAETLAARGFLRPGWPEEPASDPPRLRKRGRGSGDRALAVDGAVMGSLHRLWDGVWVACAIHSGPGEGVLPGRSPVTFVVGVCR